MAPWNRTDSLFRGEGADGTVPPSPAADASLVRHILYINGAGRQSPYLSTTEAMEIAKRFAGSKGSVRQTNVARVASHGIQHISRTELLQLLRGKGKGKASWNSPYEVMQARKLVEQWLEHLLGFQKLASLDVASIEHVLEDIFGGTAS